MLAFFLSLGLAQATPAAAPDAGLPWRVGVEDPAPAADAKPPPSPPAADAGAPAPQQTGPLPTIVIEVGARIRPLRHAFCHLQGDPKFNLSSDGTLTLDPHGVGARAELLYGDCKSPSVATVVGVGHLVRPKQDAEADLDQSSIEVHGPKMAARTAWWRLGDVGRFSESPLIAESFSEGRETAHFSVPHEAAAGALSPDRGPLEIVLPPEGMPSPDVPAVEIWDQRGVPVPLETFRVSITRFVLDQPPVGDVPIDAWREESLIPLRWPGSVGQVSCPGHTCQLTPDGSAIRIVSPGGEELRLDLTLRDPVFLRAPKGLTQSLSLTRDIASCRVKPLLPVILSGLADHQVPVQLEGNCPSDLSELSVETTPSSQATVVSVGGHGRISLSLGLVPRGAQVLRIELRAGPRRVIVGSASVPLTDAWSFTRAALHDPEAGDVDVIPTNRPVEVRVLSSDFRMASALTVEPLPGFYNVTPGKATQPTTIQGLAESGGSVPILVGYRPQEAGLAPDAPPLVAFQALPGYQIREVSVPVVLAPERPEGKQLLQVICHDSNGQEHLIGQGQIVNLPHDARHSCRLSIDHAVLKPESGPQRLRLSLTMTHPDTTTAPGSVSKVIIVRPGPQTDSLWLDPSASVHEFDHMRVTLAHDDPGHFYLGNSDSVSGAGFTALSVEIIFGNTHFRLYGSAAIPTGLYRINGPEAGAINFSAGALMRLAHLDRRGVEFPIDLEFGIFGTGISQQANLSFVLGPGLTVPILNPGQPAQASVGIHAWLEYSPTIENPNGPTSFADRVAVIFGPSVSIGDFGANF